VTLLATSSQDVLLAHLLLDLAVIAGCAVVLGGLARRFGQAAVVGEIMAGLLLGPSLLGLLPGGLDTLLFPSEVRPYLGVLASIALILFMFGIGFEIDVARLRRASSVSVRVAGASVLVPMVAGVAIAPALWSAYHPPVAGVDGPEFAAFIAIVMSVTAFPVLARILDDAKLADTSLGLLALSVAAMTDLVAWIALAVLIAALGVSHATLPFALLAIALAAFVAALAFVARPLVRWCLEGSWCVRHGPAGASLVLLAALALCAAATTLLGLHPAFGAFAFGVACPRECVPAVIGDASERALDGRKPVSVQPASRLLSAAGLVLVPIYFIVTGLQVDVTSIGVNGALAVVGVLIVATASKTVGAGWVAHRSGLDRGESLAVGLLLNTRGLTELVALDIGHRAGVLDDQLFTVLVIATILTTAMTMPLLPRALRLRTRRQRATAHVSARSSATPSQ